MPFAESLVYLFDQQIAEAGWLVVNKVALVTRHRAQHVLEKVQEWYPDKRILLQDSRENTGVRDWLEGATSGPKYIGTVTADLDYPAYGAAEAELAWLNQRITIISDTEPIGRRVEEWIARILAGLSGAGATIGHLKFSITASGKTTKVSLTTVVDPAWRHSLNTLQGFGVDILVNARVVIEAPELQRIISDATSAVVGATSPNESPDTFHPAFPEPTHRILSP